MFAEGQLQAQYQFSGRLIEWGGSNWAINQYGQFDALTQMYGKVLDREHFVDEGLKLEESYLNQYIARKVRRNPGSQLGLSNWKAVRMSLRKQELVSAVVRRFDEKYDDLCRYAASLTVVSSDQLTIDFPE